MNRLHIFFFYDQAGIVDRYIEYMLREFKKFTTRLVVVCNGKLTSLSRKKLMDITPDVIVRENKGLDVWAYIEGMQYVGWDSICQYDEMIMSNHTIIGPVFPLEEMYSYMETQPIDFWGISLFLQSRNSWLKIPYDYIPEHINSHFIAVRKPMLNSFEFRTYWEQMPQINDYIDSVSYHESIFTKTFSEYGFRYGTYIQKNGELYGSNYPIMFTARETMEEERCPFFKRKIFFYTPYDGIMHHTLGTSSEDLFEYLKNQTDYDTGMIWENALRTANMRDIQYGMHLNYYLIEEYQTISGYEFHSMAICLLPNCKQKHIRTLIYNLKKICGLLPTCVVEIESISETIKNIILKENCLNFNVEQICEDTKSFDIIHLLSFLCNQYPDSKYISVFYMDPLETQYPSYGRKWIELCVETLCGNIGYIAQIEDFFRKNDYLGLLTPPNIITPITKDTYGKEDEQYHHQLERVAKILNIPFDYRPALSPYSGMYWCRKDTLLKIKQLLQENEELSKVCSSLCSNYKGFHCLIGLLVQAVGYYPAYVMNHQLTNLAIDNMNYYLN